MATSIRYAQVIIWKRIKEINEDLLDRIVFRTVWSTTITAGAFAEVPVFVLDTYAFFNPHGATANHWHTVDRNHPLGIRFVNKQARTAGNI